MTIRRQIFIVFTILIIALISVFFINQRLSQKVLVNSAYLNNSEAVIRNSNMLHKMIIEMQGGFRGFLLTDKESFLQNYYDGIQNIPALFSQQKALVTANRQLELLDSIAMLHQQWVQYADSLITTRRDTLPLSQIRYKRLFEEQLKAEVGRSLIENIRHLFTDFDRFEYNVRTQRRARLKHSITTTYYASLSITVAIIVMVFFAGIYFVRLIMSRISVMVNLAEKISKGNFITITDTKKDELNRLVMALNQMSATLDKNFNELRIKNNELDQFAYVVSHDLKAPLRGISNIVSWMEEDHATHITPELDANFNLIKGRINRLENMINGLLEYARVEKYKIGPRHVNTNELVEEIRDLIVPAHVEFIAHELPTVYTERLHLHQVFSNLISNAFKHNKSAHPKITVSARTLKNVYEFSVSDNGPGIEKDYFEKIFLIFQTLQERDAFESTGVGLAIVKKIVEDNKGTITVDSQVGKGTTFTFTIPKHDPVK